MFPYRHCSTGGTAVRLLRPSSFLCGSVTQVCQHKSLALPVLDLCKPSFILSIHGRSPVFCLSEDFSQFFTVHSYVVKHSVCQSLIVEWDLGAYLHR